MRWYGIDDLTPEEIAKITATLKDMEPASWQQMLCVEAAAIDAAVIVAPGQCWKAAQHLTAH